MIRPLVYGGFLDGYFYEEISASLFILYKRLYPYFIR